MLPLGRYFIAAIKETVETGSVWMKNSVKTFSIVYIVACAAILAVFSYVMLDFFVIPRDYGNEAIGEIALRTPQPESATLVPEESPGAATPGENGETDRPDETPGETPEATGGENNDPTPSLAPTPEPTDTPEPTPTPTPEDLYILTDNRYRSETGDIDITMTKYREYDTDVYVADVKVKDPLLFMTGLAKDTYGRNIIETTSSQASRHNAILAINGDFYGKRENGFVVRNGKIWRNTVSGRNERNTYDDIAVLQDGSFVAFNEKQVSFDEVVSWGPWQVFSFGPTLIKEGEIVVGAYDDVMAHLESNPRTAIAEVSPGHYLLMVSDGRTVESEGLSLRQMAEILKSLGAVNAYNMDGGGSSAMYFNGKIINKPVNNGRITERFVSDIIYIPKEG